MKELIGLYTSFFKVGLFTFGGGYAMLPLLEREVVDKKHYVTNQDLIDYFAIGQCTPGIIAVNVATFSGLQRRGIVGAIFSTLGLVSPSVIIILLLSSILSLYMTNPIVMSAFNGIKVGVSILVLNAVIKLLKNACVSKLTTLIYILVLVVGLLADVSPVIFVAVAIILGILIQVFKTKGGNK